MTSLQIHNIECKQNPKDVHWKSRKQNEFSSQVLVMIFKNEMNKIFFLNPLYVGTNDQNVWILF